MPLPGGSSDKYGNRYEGKWTAYCMARVMAEEADFIRLEPLGQEGEGIEFTLCTGDIFEYHQVKRQHARAGDWSIKELSTKGVLDHAFAKTRDPNGRYVFVSTTSTGILATLIDAAKRSESLSEFKEHFLKGKKVKAWNDLLDKWHDLINEEIVMVPTASEEEVELFHQHISYERIKRIGIRTLDEGSLAEMVDTKLRTLVRSDPATVRNALYAMALESIHNKLNADTIWSCLGEQYARVDYSTDVSVLAKLKELNDRYEYMIKDHAGGIRIPREEVATVMGILRGDSRKTSALVSGEAGVGKTCVLGQVIQQLKTESTPHLYFRIDRLEPTDLPSKVAEQLGLPSTPAEVLAGVARGRQCVLIIDQLDAVSMVSGRNPEFFHCVHEIIRQTTAFPNMRLLLACRRFDIEKDNRLRELVSENGLAEEVIVKPFTSEGVKNVLEQIGCRASDYGDRQLELLRLPLHLSLFAEVIKDHGDTPFIFATSVEIFDEFWVLKRKAVNTRIGHGNDQWIAVLDRLCDRMTGRQKLFVPEVEVLDDYVDTIRAMESEHVLILDSGRIGFFHEGFFDYVFARRFASRDRDLIQYLKDGEQGLFKRAPLRQILLYTHATKHADFVKELWRVSMDSSIRFHLRQCAIEMAKKVECATPELWQMFQEIFATEDPVLIREVWRVIGSVSSWFSFLHDKGLVAEWLASDDHRKHNHAIMMIRNHIKSYPGQCVELLTPYVGVSDKWNTDILHIIWHRVLATDRRVFDLFMRIHSLGVVKNEGVQDFWTSIDDLPNSRPDWAAEALAQHLRSMTNMQPEDIKLHSPSGERVVLEVAKKAPAAFLEAVLPVFIDVVMRTAQDCDGKLMIDRVWCYRSYRDECISFESALLLGIEDALKVLANTSVSEYTSYINQLKVYGNYDSVNFVIVRALTVAPPELADDTVEYLQENPKRLECGWSFGGGGDFHFWAAQKLIEHVAQHCENDAFERIEAVMIDHFPQWEKSKEGYRFRGEWQFVMLSALPTARLGSSTEAQLGKWHRKFPGREIQPPTASMVRCVGSPIEARAISRMKNSDWLRAFEAYDSDSASHRRPHVFLEGGAQQLSSVIESETERDPIRFAKLSEQFPANIHQYYYHALLRGLEKSNADMDTVLPVVRRVFELRDKPGHRYLCDAIDKFSDEDIPEDILTIVGWCATESDDPKSDDLTKRSSEDDEDNSFDHILNNAINTVRGAAAQTVGSLLFDKEDRIPFFMPYLERMVHDLTVTVRATVANALLCLYKHDEVRAVDLFLVLVDTNNDHLFATHYVDRFLHYANVRHFHRLQPLLRRMLDSSVSAVREAGARHICLAQFSNQDVTDMVTECITGDDDQRKGAVSVAAANLFSLECAEYTHTVLPIFFNDPVKKIRDEAAKCFRRAEGRDLENAKPIIRAFLESAAFGENVDDLMRPMENSTADIAEEILMTCEAVISHMETISEAPTYQLHGQADNIVELVLRAYRQTDVAEVRTRCLDIVDRLLAQEVYGIAKELVEFER